MASIYSVGLSHMSQYVRAVSVERIRRPTSGWSFSIRNGCTNWSRVDQVDIGLVSYSQDVADDRGDAWREEPMTLVCAAAPCAGAAAANVALAELDGLTMVGFDDGPANPSRNRPVLAERGVNVRGGDGVRQHRDVEAGGGDQLRGSVLLPEPTVRAKSRWALSRCLAPTDQAGAAAGHRAPLRGGVWAPRPAVLFSSCWSSRWLGGADGCVRGPAEDGMSTRRAAGSRTCLDCSNAHRAAARSSRSAGRSIKPLASCGCDGTTHDDWIPPANTGSTIPPTKKTAAASVSSRTSRANAVTRSCSTPTRCLRNMDHRGACGCEAEHGRRRGHADGAAARVPGQGRPATIWSAELPEPGQFGAGSCSCRSDDAERERVQAARRSRLIAEQGQRLVGLAAGARRETEEADIGPDGPGGRAAHRAAVRRGRRTVCEGDAFERQLYLIRKRASHAVARRPAAAAGQDVLHLQPVDQGHHLQGHAHARSVAALLSRTWRIRTTRRTWRWCTRGSRPTRFPVGTALSRTASCATTARSTRCAATSTGCGPAKACVHSDLFGDELPQAVSDRRTRLLRLGHLRQRAGVPADDRPHAAGSRHDDDSRSVAEARDDVGEQAGLLRVPLLPDGALGRSGVDRLHRRPVHRRGARPQRPAAQPLLPDPRRPGDHGQRGGRAAGRPASWSRARGGCSRAGCSWSISSRAA